MRTFFTGFAAFTAIALCSSAAPAAAENNGGSAFIGAFLGAAVGTALRGNGGYYTQPHGYYVQPYYGTSYYPEYRERRCTRPVLVRTVFGGLQVQRQCRTPYGWVTQAEPYQQGY